MKIVLIISLTVICLSNILADEISDERAHVVQTLTEIEVLLRLKHNLTTTTTTRGRSSSPFSFLIELQPSSPDELKRLQIFNDIQLTLPQANEILDNLRQESSSAQHDDKKTRRVFKYDFAKWTTFPIAYSFDGTHSDADKEIIRQGIDRWQSSTCITFREFASPLAIGNRSGIVFTSNQGCQSFVGRYTIKRPQPVSLGPNCLTPGITSHEIGHALGLWHEHTRADRDNYLTINWHNLIDGYANLFAKVPQDIDIYYETGYDPSSIMHYDSLALSKDENGMKRVMVPKNVYHLTAIGQREYLSFNDVKRVNFHYKCIERACSGVKLLSPCKNNGYQDPKNCARCRCPAGYGGDFCDKIAPPTGDDVKKCGGLIEMSPCSTVTLMSPNYPRHYPADSSCTWQLQPTNNNNNNSRLIFAFEHQPYLNAKFSGSCIDYVDIKIDDDKQSIPGSRFCFGGKSAGRVAIVDHQRSAALVHFASASMQDGGGGNFGFKLNVYSTCNDDDNDDIDECLITKSGYDYVGTKNNNNQCQLWSDDGQSAFNEFSFPDDSLLEAGSKCRNPDSRASPWCFTINNKVAYCKNIPPCRTTVTNK